MEARRFINGASSRPRRKPLADLTNAQSLRLSTAADSVKPKPRPKLIPEQSGTKSPASNAGSSDHKDSGDLELPKSTPVSKEISSSVSGVDSGEEVAATSKRGSRSSFKLELVKEERKNVSFKTAFSCPPVGRTQKLRNNSGMKHVLNQNVAACSEPCQKKKKRPRRLGPDDNVRLADKGPLEDFIRKQRAYFAEVDSFELPEEVVSESELE
ncbi:hypothetical protein KSP39_PZI006715 [Platanthera zijinensis]|uniref:Sororin C-terminal region domain-containing protein n=1 Tax=Platanthera zijinensis TaxID=2320716 RepID=A0AAP0BR38_9ASPA